MVYPLKKTRQTQHATDKIQNQHIEHEKLSLLHSIYQVMAKNVLIKTQKPQPCYCPDGQMAKLSVSQVESIACMGSNPVWANYPSFPQTFFYCKFIPTKDFQYVFLTMLGYYNMG